ncbi:SMI1/KNR4 family protein [Embleya sp. NPDC005575]|uniref:SMI1/KNR4 family protein n=1 Tax=Embleya sp. NPDC005575 TaxID=3156892 RepID=UPI0033A1FE82
MDDTTTAFERVWDRFEPALAVFSPLDHAALRGPAVPGTVERLRDRLGFALHPQLAALWERHDGVRDPEETGVFHGSFLVGYRLHGIDDTTRGYAFVEEQAQDFEEVFVPEHYVDGFREDFPDGHIASWVPFARAIHGGEIYVDHHPGPLWGTVFECSYGECTVWATDLADLFDRLADSLEHGTPFRGERPLTWTDPDGNSSITWEHD